MITRRQFAQFVTAGGVGLAFVGCQPRATADRPLTPGLWLELHADGPVRMLTPRVEMGQGAHTGLRTLVAEELDIDPQSIVILQVPSDPKYGEIITGGSFTLAGWHERMRQAAATARSMLIRAAANRWGVPVAEIATANGHVLHEVSGQRGRYTRFVTEAAALPVPPPESITLKSPKAWRYIGKRAPIAYHRAIRRGAASYGIDTRLPSMCFAVLARAPVLGARLRAFDDATCRSVPGFIKAVALAGNEWPALDHRRDAVAVVATNSWAAQKARAVLQVSWDRSARVALDSAAMFRRLAELCSRPGIMSHARGSIDASRTTRSLQAEYRFPYLAHVPIEPPNATARVAGGRVEVWCGNQRQTRMKDAIVKALGISPHRVTVYANLIGGSFGRRLEIDYGVEAACLAVRIEQPVQVLWTREDDLAHGLYRSGSVHCLAASLDKRGRMATFEHRYAAESVVRQQEPHQLDPSTGDWTLATPLVAMVYDVPNVRLEHQFAEPMAPCTWWRGTYWTNVTTAVECFIDELAQESAQDPLAFRLAHLASDQPREFVINKDTRIPFHPARARAVLQAAAERAGWSSPVPEGHARGLAFGLYDSPECHAAVVAEMALRAGTPTLISATVAVDVGTVVNPEIVKSQAMGGFVMGASAALREQITWRDGEVMQRGFHDYPVMRMAECPLIDIVLVPSDAGICGVGEIVTPAAMAAVSNAYSRLRGRRARIWPLVSEESSTG